MAKKIKKKNKRMYFDEDVQDAIVQYNSEENPNIRNKLYSEKIAYAFDKLAENIINTFKFSYFSYGFRDLQEEVVSNLVLNMHKYDASKGFKAFSYFSVVAKNYLILVNNGNYKKLKLHKDLDASATIKELKELSQTNDDSDTVVNEFINEVVKYFEENISRLFKKKRDIDIAYSIVELISNRKEIDNFNKKSLYLLIREMTGVNTMYITKIINIMKRHYKRLSNEFYGTGTINHLPLKNIFLK